MVVVAEVADVAGAERTPVDMGDDVKVLTEVATLLTVFAAELIEEMAADSDWA